MSGSTAGVGCVQESISGELAGFLGFLASVIADEILSETEMKNKETSNGECDTVTAVSD